MDGEGCLRWDGSCERVYITSCYPHHLGWIRSKFGGYFREIQGNTKSRTCYRLEMSGQRARSFVSKILPHLQEKRYQGELFMSLRSVPRRTASHDFIVKALTAAKKVDYAIRTQRSV